MNEQSQPKLRTDAAASHLGVSESWLEKSRVFGGGPVYFKVGRTVVYDIADLDAWLSDKRRTSTSAAAQEV